VGQHSPPGENAQTFSSGRTPNVEFLTTLHGTKRSTLEPLPSSAAARLAALHKRLLARTPGAEVVGRPLRRRQGALLDAVTNVLERASCPLRVREVHAAVEELYGERVPFSSVNEALSTQANASQTRPPAPRSRCLMGAPGRRPALREGCVNSVRCFGRACRPLSCRPVLLIGRSWSLFWSFSYLVCCCLFQLVLLGRCCEAFKELEIVVAPARALAAEASGEATPAHDRRSRVARCGESAACRGRSGGR
jgi:hypothetical protein